MKQHFKAVSIKKAADVPLDITQQLFSDSAKEYLLSMMEKYKSKIK